MASEWPILLLWLQQNKYEHARFCCWCPDPLSQACASCSSLIMQESVGTALYEFSNSSCVWGWLVSNLSLVHPAPACERSQTLPVSVIATVMQVLNTFVLSMYQPAWDRRNKLNFKRTDMSAFYQVCLISFVLSATSGSWLIGCKCVAVLVFVRNALPW